MIFDTREFVTLLFAIIAFIFILIANRKSKNDVSSREVWIYLLVAASLILLNRLFTNIEEIVYKDAFNFLEHLSIVFSALAFLLVALKTYKEME